VRLSLLDPLLAVVALPSGHGDLPRCSTVARRLPLSTDVPLTTGFERVYRPRNAEPAGCWKYSGNSTASLVLSDGTEVPIDVGEISLCEHLVGGRHRGGRVRRKWILWRDADA